MRVSPALAAAGAGAALAILLAPQSARAQQPPPPGYQQPPPPNYQQQPPPGYYQQQPPPGYQQQPPPGYYQQRPPSGYGYGYNEPPPPPPKPPESSGFTMPTMSVRVDPFNWLIEGRLGFELESSVWKFISVELVPVFVVNDTPPTLNYFNGWKDNLTQESNGLGALSGTSIDAGFWLNGKPMKGNVVRVIFTNYGMTYKTKDSAGKTIDHVSHTERRIYGYFGSHMKWGFFTIATGIGLGVELNRQKRCFPSNATSVSDAKTSGCNHLELALDPNLKQVVDVNPALYPVDIMARFSLGVVF